MHLILIQINDRLEFPLGMFYYELKIKIKNGATCLIIHNATEVHFGAMNLNCQRNRTEMRVYVL